MLGGMLGARRDACARRDAGCDLKVKIIIEMDL